MNTIEKDIEKIKQFAIIYEKQNYRFRKFLKEIDNNDLDTIVYKLNLEIESRIDCTQCGNCCIYLRPSLNEEEIDTLSGIDNLPRNVFIDNYTEEDGYDNKLFLKDMPCKYLQDKKCTIVNDRPSDCKSFPHIHKPNFNSRTFNMLDYYGICPIVFIVFERLKSEFRFK